MYIIQTIIEAALILIIILGFLNEQKLVDFENRVFTRLKSKLPGGDKH